MGGLRLTHEIKGEVTVLTDQNDWDLDVQEESQLSGPKALRDAYERQKQEASELKNQLKTLTEKVRAQEVGELLTSKGIPKEAFSLFPKDIEVTDESVNSWVEKYGGLFGAPAPKQEVKEEETPASQEETPQKVDQDQLRQIQQVTSGGTPGGASKQDFETALANPNLHDEMPYEAFLEMLRGQGVKV